MDGRPLPPSGLGLPAGQRTKRDAGVELIAGCSARHIWLAGIHDQRSRR